MRIVVDIQGAQSTGSRNRGIGRYTLSIVKALIRQRGRHDVIIAASGLFADSINDLKKSLGVESVDILNVWTAPGPVAWVAEGGECLRRDAELTYEAFLLSLRPDILFITSLFEGFSDDVVTSVHQLQKVVPVAVTLYDLIPYLNPDPYLLNPQIKAWYSEKIAHLRRADLVLAISESARQEGVACLGFDDMHAVNVGTDADPHFRKIDISPERTAKLLATYGISKKFVMYTGGIDHRKNVEGLIRAYSILPSQMRAAHQLAIVCSVQPHTESMLLKLAQEHGLAEGELVLTGYVPEDDLLALYNLCHLFVFPSKHEGFGLPALEAMRCGAAVIGANTSSLPEVIGWEEALFDPYSDAAIAAAMQRALDDELFRKALMQSGLDNALRFSWDDSARRALTAMEKVHQEWLTNNKTTLNGQVRPKLAYVSPLPPARSGIADYSAELLPALAIHYDIEVIVDQTEAVAEPWVLRHCPIRPVQCLLDNAGDYNRVLYHFGNSHFHQHMFDLIERVPGVVVLHDFFLSGIQAHRDVQGQAPGAWSSALLKSHGYKSVVERYTAQDTADVVFRYPANLPVLQESLGVIVHSQSSKRLAKSWYGDTAGDDWHVIPLLRQSPSEMDRVAAREALGFSEGALLVCSFGLLGTTKQNHRLLQAWLDSSLAQDSNAHLVFVGQNDGGAYGASLLRMIANHPAGKRVRITGWTDVQLFQQYLSAADIGVQLRTLSRGETSAAVLDCMNYGLATIVNANGSMADLDPHGVWLLADEFEDADLSQALETLADNADRRRALGAQAQAIIRAKHDPSSCAEAYFHAIEQAYQQAATGLQGVMANAAKEPHTDSELRALAVCLADNFPPRPRLRQLLVDISELVQRDAKTGIQRVVKAILSEWLANPPAGFRVEPVFATVDKCGYRYARSFVSKWLGLPVALEIDSPVECWQGDVFVGLDLQPHVVPAQAPVLQSWRSKGVQMWFVVYDMLPITLPQFFYESAMETHATWAESVASYDGVVCISKSVAVDFAKWLDKQNFECADSLAIKSFSLGADLAASQPTVGLPEGWRNINGSMQSRPSFLMVGTVEPRKGHAQVLDAFDLLWDTGCEVNLFIIGKQGGQVEALVDRLRAHPLAGEKLFWLEGVSDECLDKVYAASSCLIAASYGEGFGLPLIEAAQHQLPILARDIPVFREVADEYAEYFNADKPEQLAQAIQAWLLRYEQGAIRSSENMPWLTWQQSAQQLLSKILPST
ncbi:glycosyltransferase [Aeromonas veronii]